MARYRKEEIKAGLVLMGALLVFSAMMVFIGGSTFWEKYETYHVEFSAIGGLEKGASVRLGGFRIGQVLDIAVSPDDASKIDVTIGVKPGTPIYKGIVASVHTLGLVGDYYVLLTQRPEANTPLAPGSSIASRDMVEIGDLLIQAAELSRTLNASIQKVMAAVERVLSEENITSVQTALQGLTRLTTRGERSLTTLTTHLERMLKKVNATATTLDSIIVENRGNVEQTLRAIRRSAENLDKLTVLVNQMLVENQEDLRSAVIAIKEDSRRTGDLIDNLNGRVSVTGDYLEETMANLTEISENLRLLSNRLKRQPWRLIYRERLK